jgi:hypothetical protein
VAPPWSWRRRASLESAAEGWLAGLSVVTVVALGAVVTGHHGWWPEGEPPTLVFLGVVGLLSATFLFVVVAWLIVALPFVGVLPHRGWLFTPAGASFTGLLLGTSVMTLYFAYPFDRRLAELVDVWPFLLWAGVSGGVGFYRYVRRAKQGCPIG